MTGQVSLITLVILSLILKFSLADLPVHCLKHQIVGTWELQTTKAHNSTDGHLVNCGHHEPDEPLDSWNAFSNSFSVFQKIVVRLNADNSVSTNENENAGNWTMVYDEAMEIIINNERFMSFFYYSPITPKVVFDENNYVSNCSRTTVGWWRRDNGERACFKAIKINATEENNTAVSAPANLHIVQPKEVQSASILNQQSPQQNKRNFRKSSTRLLMSKSFRDHAYVVDRLNLIQTKSWVANTHQTFEGMTVKDLNRLAGRRSSVLKANDIVKIPSYQTEDVSDLPKELSWKDTLGEVREQGDCGSCYILSTLQMLEGRLKIHFNETVRLSPQHPLDCSFYNQGCDGGYPYLVEKWAQEFELLSEIDCPYSGSESTCGSCDVAKAEKHYKVSSYRFIGGAYGKSTERNMMLELMNNGPIVVSFEPAYDFMYYQSGVYHSVDAADWIRNGEEKPEWEKVDHSVLCYGWGETPEGEKYWLLRNSWGERWGEGGDFRLRRGTDESAIESLAEAADPYIVFNKV